MKKDFKVLVLGKGRIGQAIAYYLKKNKLARKVAFFSKEGEIKDFDILIGALPSRIAKKGLKLALKYKKDLVDVSAVPIPFYLRFKKEILKKGLKVIPGCGFSPGLVNLISGFESNKLGRINEIGIEAGTLPRGIKFFFPFTWCFEDLIEQHLYPASIIKNGKKINLPPFSGYKKEKLKKIGEFESYFVEEWSSLPYSLKPKNLSFRVIRPVGFFHFFQYLKNFGFFKKENLSLAKKILTGKQTDNITLALVKVFGIFKKKKKEIIWRIFCFAKKNEKLNSMQKITASVPIAILNLLSQNKIKDKGILFMEEIGKDDKLFQEILEKLKKEEILIKKKGAILST